MTETTSEGAFTAKSENEEYRQSISHVFQCMQCDLQFQADTEVVDHEGGQAEEQLVRLRLPDDISPAQRAMAEQIAGRLGGMRQTVLPTQPLRDEHSELLPHVEQLRTVGDAIGMIPFADVLQSIDEVYTFLTRQLLPHAQAEERVLYPLVGKLLGAAEATATMRQEHRSISQLSHELGTLRLHASPTLPTVAEEQTLRRLLYGLYALVLSHFAKEEDIYLPLLDAHLSAQETQRMFEDMEKAAQEAKRSVAV